MALLDWIKTRLGQRLEDQAIFEITAFVANLRDSSDEDLGVCAAQAADVCYRLKASGINLSRPGQIQDLDRLTTMLTEATLEVRSKQPFRAPGMMVWVHTLRAQQRDDLRPHVVLMWQHVERGFWCAEVSARHFEDVTGYRLTIGDCLVVPDGFVSAQPESYV